MQLTLLSQCEMLEAQLQFAHVRQLKPEIKLSRLIVALMSTDSCLHVCTSVGYHCFIYRLSYPYCTLVT